MRIEKTPQAVGRRFLGVGLLVLSSILGSADGQNCTSPIRWPPPRYLPTSASAARVWRESIQALSSCAPVIRCVDFAILAACGPENVDNCTYDAFGDGFSRLKLSADGSIPDKARRIMELGENETVAVDLFSELEGVNAWLLRNISTVANVRITVDIFRLPDSLRNSPDRVKQLDYVFNKLQGKGYDCALPSTIASFDRAPLMKFLVPNQPFGFIVVSPDPRAALSNARQRLFSWTRPFSGPLWVTLFATLIAIGLGMAWFEHRKNPRDFSTAHKTPWKYWSQNAWHGIYTAVAHWPGCGFFLSVTVPGRVHNVAYSIFQRLLLATYTAGLASNLVVTRTPPRVILGLSSFQETGIPACVLNRTSHLDFVRQNYPKLQVHIVPSGASISVLLDAVNAGTCGGAISTNVHLEYGIGLGDVNGRFCNLSATGANLGVGFYAIPFNLATDDVVIDAATDITSATITDNTYYKEAMFVQFSNNRTACAPVPAVSTTKFLDLTDTAGIFVIQGVGIVAAVLLQLWKKMKFKHRASGPTWLWGSPPPPDPLQLKLEAAKKEEEQQEQMREAEEAGARAALAVLLQAQRQQKELLGRIVRAAQERAEREGEDTPGPLLLSPRLGHGHSAADVAGAGAGEQGGAGPQAYLRPRFSQGSALPPLTPAGVGVGVGHRGPPRTAASTTRLASAGIY